MNAVRVETTVEADGEWHLTDLPCRRGDKVEAIVLILEPTSRPGTTAKQPLSAGRQTPAELWRMPRAQRQAVLAAAAKLAEQDYHADKELTGFQAFSAVRSGVDHERQAGAARRRFSTCEKVGVLGVLGILAVAAQAAGGQPVAAATCAQTVREPLQSGSQPRGSRPVGRLSRAVSETRTALESRPTGCAQTKCEPLLYPSNSLDSYLSPTAGIMRSGDGVVSGIDHSYPQVRQSVPGSFHRLCPRLAMAQRGLPP